MANSMCVRSWTRYEAGVSAGCVASALARSAKARAVRSSPVPDVTSSPHGSTISPTDSSTRGAFLALPRSRGRSARLSSRAAAGSRASLGGDRSDDVI
jgi:hypothetical protein